MRRDLEDIAQGFETIQLGDGVRFELPTRPLGAARLFGLIPLLFGVVFVLVPSGMVLSMLGDVVASRDEPADWFLLLPLLFAVPFIAAGLVPISLGLAVLVGRNAVEVSRGKVRSIERVWFFRRSRTRPIDAVRRIEVIAGSGKALRRTTAGQRSPAQITDLMNLAGLRARCDGKKDMLLAWGYPRPMLLAVADGVADEADADRPARLFDEDERHIEVAEQEIDFTSGRIEDIEGLGEEVIPPQPTGSRSVLDVQDAGMTISVPPAGLRKGSKGLFGFSLLWCGFMTVFTTLMVLALTGVIDAESNINSVGEMIAAFAFVGLFWVIGIAMMVGAVNAGRRRAVVDVVGAGPHATLLITRQSLFGTKQDEWAAEQLSHVCVGPSNIEVNNRRVMELQVHPKEGKKVGLLRQLDDDELAWIAANLRVAMGLPRRAWGDEDS